jgi:maltooligosyltrehalose trehalohydrolase
MARPVQFTAQWNDDLHHVLHTAATGEDAGYYAEYAGDALKLGRALAEGFAFQGEVMKFRGRPRGSPSAHLPTDTFIAFIQNHDQIGNRAFGERLNQIAGPAALRAVAAVYLLLPQIPMLFMGEEWIAAQPFPFFCDFHGELADRVTEGRRAEFARFPQFQDAHLRARIPDAQAAATFESAKLDWGVLQREPHSGWLSWYRSILRIRKAEIVPRLRLIVSGGTSYQILGHCAVQVQWRVGSTERLELSANLSGDTIEHCHDPSGRILWQENTAARSDSGLAPWSVCWRIVQSG